MGIISLIETRQDGAQLPALLTVAEPIDQSQLLFDHVTCKTWLEKDNQRIYTFTVDL